MEINGMNSLITVLCDNKYIAKYAAQCSVIGSVGVLVLDSQEFIANIIILIWGIINGYLYLYYSRKIKNRWSELNGFDD